MTSGNGQELPPFHETRVGVDDPADIRRSYEENTYVFFKGVLDKELILQVKDEAVAELQRQGIVEPGQSEPVVIPGKTHNDIDDDAIYGLPSYSEVRTSRELQEAVETVYGEPARIARSIGFRHAMPEDAPHTTPPHQDHFYIRETDQFRMIWIPLMDLEIESGGLAIAAGSHTRGLIDHVELEGTESTGFKGRSQKGVPDDQIGGEWTSSPMEVGDFLTWHSCGVHKALPNTTNKARLSLNTMTYPARLPEIWQAEKTIPELQDYREEMRDLAAEEGIDEDTFEVLFIEAMKQGAEASRETVRELAAAVG